MKKDIAYFCLECQGVKAEHQHPAVKLDPNDIPERKWTVVSTDLRSGIPKSRNRHDKIRVVVDRLTQVAHFRPAHQSRSRS